MIKTVDMAIEALLNEFVITIPLNQDEEERLRKALKGLASAIEFDTKLAVKSSSK